MSAPVGANGEPYNPLTPGLTSIIVEPILTGNVIGFTLFGVGLLQFFLVTEQFLELRKRAGEWKSADKFNLIILSIFFFSDLGDSITKAIFVDRYVRGVIVSGKSALAFAPRTVAALCVTDGWMALLVHLIYARRLVRITGSKGLKAWLLAGIGLVISIVQFGAAIITGVQIEGPAATWDPELVPAASTWLAGAAAADLYFAFAFVLNLARHKKSQQGYSNNLVKFWMVFTLEIGLITSAMQLLHLFLFLFIDDPNKVHHLGVAMVVTKIYVNSILLLMRNVLDSRLNPTNVVVTSSLAGSGSNKGTGDGTLSTSNNFARNKHSYPATHSGGAASGIVISSEMHYESENVELPIVKRLEVRRDQDDKEEKSIARDEESGYYSRH